MKPQIKATRSNVAKNRSMYTHVLSDLCKDKSTTNYCNECNSKYKQMSYIKTSCEKRRKLALENQPGSVNKAINNSNSQSTDDYSKKNLCIHIYYAMPALKNLKKKGATHVRKNITVQRVNKIGKENLVLLKTKKIV